MKELEEIITEVGGKGTFQKRLLYLILAPIYFLQPLYWMNELFFLHVPSHWCNPPNTDILNFLNETRFKDCYIPRKEIDNSYDTCNILVHKDWAKSKELNSIVPSDPTYCPSLIQKENPLDNDVIKTSCERMLAVNLKTSVVNSVAKPCKKFWVSRQRCRIFFREKLR